MLLLATGALLAGVVAGLTGFGTSMTAMAFWLYVIAPVVATPLACICAISAHLVSLRKIWSGFDIKGAAPILIGGLVGVPIGAYFLKVIDPGLFRIVIGGFLVAYAIFMFSLKTPPIIKKGGALADGLSGFGGGVLGGFSGLSGAMPAIWVMLRGWTKERQRSIIQSFNMLILSFALVVYLVGGLISREVLIAAAVCLPATFLGSNLGARIYTGIDKETFRKVVLVLLSISGAVLVVTSFKN